MEARRYVVDDPDEKIEYWIVRDDRDRADLKEIEQKGSIQLFMEAEANITGDAGLPLRMRQAGFTWTLTEEIEFTAYHLKLGNSRQNSLFAFLDRLCSRAAVVGAIPMTHLDTAITESYDNGHINAQSRYQEVKPELVEWLLPVLRVIGERDANCFLYAEFNYPREEIQKVLKEIFPGMQVYVGRNGLSIAFLELKRWEIAIIGR